MQRNESSCDSLTYNFFFFLLGQSNLIVCPKNVLDSEQLDTEDQGVLDFGSLEIC